MSRVVFVGNVPYNMGEEQLIDVFKTVGSVVGFRLVFDRETGKPRGYGFCEFTDHDAALSAVLHLNNTDCGGRSLRIDLAESDPSLEGKTTMHGELIDNIGGGWRNRNREGASERDREYRSGLGSRSGGGSGEAWIHALPHGTPLPPGVTAMDAISQTVAGVRPIQMMEVLASMKNFILEQPESAHALLSAHPQLAYALFQSLLVNQIVDPSILHRMIAATQGQNPSAPPAPLAHHVQSPTLHMLAPTHQAPPPHIQPPQHPQQHIPQPAAVYQAPPPAPQPHMGYPPAPAPAPVPVPAPAPAQQNVYHASLPPRPAPAPTEPTTSVADAQRAMLIQMLQLTDEQVNALPPHERQAIQQLKSQFLALGNNMSLS